MAGGWVDGRAGLIKIFICHFVLLKCNLHMKIRQTFITLTTCWERCTRARARIHTNLTSRTLSGTEVEKRIEQRRKYENEVTKNGKGGRERARKQKKIKGRKSSKMMSTPVQSKAIMASVYAIHFVVTSLVHATFFTCTFYSFCFSKKTPGGYNFFSEKKKKFKKPQCIIPPRYTDFFPFICTSQ